MIISDSIYQSIINKQLGVTVLRQ